MYLVPSSTHELIVVLSPDAFDRNTEKHFQNLFEKAPAFIYPAWKYPDQPVPEITSKSVLLFEGGTDITTGLYKQRRAKTTQSPDSPRDQHETRLFNKAQEAGAACVGICRGAQLLCALSGGELIQDVGGHQTTHLLQLPDRYNRAQFQTTSTHHQMMNPYVLPRKEWLSFGHAPEGVSTRYKDEFDNKIKVRKRWKDWLDQEIVWFKKTRCLSIQGHPEYFTSQDARFVIYCRFLLHTLILNRETPSDGISTP